MNVIAGNVTKAEGKLILNSLDNHGAKAGEVGVKGLYEIARQLGRNEGVGQVIINGNVRSSGIFIDKIPSQVIINIKY